MQDRRTVDFLPPIFQTPTNRQFLSATLDQLTQEPRFSRREGFIGRTVGAGVNPDDRYIVEPNKSRADYQLEPGVVALDVDASSIKDVMTYAGMADTVTANGGNGSRPDRLYKSEFYSWDPFVDFDAFVNFSQYYWLPAGPDPVTVRSTGIPSSATFTVTRQNGEYTFSGLPGTNPTLQLLRNGNYNFVVAQNNKETVNYRVRNIDTGAYLIDGQSNPTLTLERGNTYVFNLTLRGFFPFWIKTALTLGTDDQYNQGVSRNGSDSGLITFVVPQDAPDVLYYVSENQSNMRGELRIVDAQSGTGPGFWIQTSPGVGGVIPSTPNISNRDVYGVTNNGEDLGLVNFAVPTRTAQEFFFNLNTLTTNVDLITGLRFDQINNIPVTQFLAEHGGIDGISALDGRTLVFANTPPGDAGGWQRTSFFDPLVQNPDNNGLEGSFDSVAFDLSTDIPVTERYQVYQISTVNLNGVLYFECNRVADIPNLYKFQVRYGNQFSSTSWYKDSIGSLKQVPLLTAQLDRLYYQDGTDPSIFGEIELIDDQDSETLFVDRSIIGQPQYTSPNGVVFTNGLKVVFQGDVEPARYGSGDYTFTCSSTNPEFDTLTTLSTAELYPGQQVVFSAPTIGGLVPGTIYYVRDIINDFEFTLSSIKGGPLLPLEPGTVAGGMRSVAINYREFYVAGVGSAIQLLPVDDFICPESYVVDNDTTTSLVEPGQPDYFTIDRASASRNAWSRSNRWFHLDVINATAAYNNTVADPNINFKARRPILQFRPNIRLYNMGVTAIDPIDIIDLEQTDAFSNVQGSTAYSVDGYQFVNGTRVIFAADIDPQVRNRVYAVEFVYPDTQPPLIAQPFINLVEVDQGLVLADQSVLILDGNTLKGRTYWYDGLQWIRAQQKNGVQQTPLFDVYDADGVSYGNQTRYPSSDFVGSPLFSYAVNQAGVSDEILGFPLRYLSIANIGDIVFDNNLYVDSFTYTLDNVSTVQVISDGTPREYVSRVSFDRRLGWQTAVTETLDYQQFKFVYSGQPLELDIPVLDQAASMVPVIKIYANSNFVDPSKYTVQTLDGSTFISLLDNTALDSVIEVLALSESVSAVGFYQIPSNLENNPLNQNAPIFTLGTVRQHYQSLCENIVDISGEIIGQNNSRDLGNIVPYGLQIVQQSSPLTLAGYFMRSQDFDIFAALRYNGREYIKFKNLILDQVTQQTISYETTAEILDNAIETLTQGRTQSDPFYWSDMLPSGAVFTEITYTISFTSTDTFDIGSVYDFTQANYQAINVYLNDVILMRGRDYVVATDGPRIQLLLTPAIGDVLRIREYNDTVGNYVPNTPTKIGAYPAWRPEIVTVKTTTGNQTVIIGHDGSQTVTFNDIRDQVLLEFETRIYNNLKLDGNPVPILATDALPGQFRDTGYSYQEINRILESDFLSYVAWNKLDYTTQSYAVSNEFSYNYSRTPNKLDNQDLLGAWRGINRFFYDTVQPQITPWEMLGFSVRPDWWEQTYGSAPYTAGNLVLWDDIAQGLVRDPAGPYILPQYARPGVLDVVPVGSQGNLMPPLETVAGAFDTTTFRRSWAVGDGGPVEASWWNSSLYPFAVMRMLALTRPAKFYALLADRDLYRYETDFGQFLYNKRYRLDANGIEVYGDGVSKASYLNWLVDYNRQTGINSTELLTQDLKNLTVRLCYRMAGFSDKRLIQLFTEKTTPDSTNTSLLLPDSTYQLQLYKNPVFARLDYSALIIQRTTNGFQVSGYNTVQPFFQILRSLPSGRLQTISVAGATVRVPQKYTNQVVSVPYGFEFTDRTSVCDFILSYGEFLQSQGLVFDNIDNGYQLSWNQMAQEFLYWSQQGWGTEALLNLNPLASRLSVQRAGAIVDNIQAKTTEQSLLDQNRRELAVKDLNITRLGNTFTIEPTGNQTIGFVSLAYTNFEHILVLDGASEFGDLIYAPTTGARQNRLRLAATVSADWDGSVNAPGFVLNQDNVKEWTGTRVYAKGEIVRYKNNLWSAATIVQPSEQFDVNDWLPSDYDEIEQGLLPNLALKSDQLIESYDINRANLENEQDLFSYGLIGFRPRQYLAALNLNDVSQLNVYRQFLSTKGTVQSTDLFTRIDFDKEIADYNIYENWALLRAVYGANANRSFIEFRLNRALLSPNPSTIQVIQPGQTSLADQSILLDNVWRQSYRLNNTDILPTTLITPTDTALPSAGYINVDDADITLFDLRAPGALDGSLDEIVNATSIWAAKTNDYDWDIFRCSQVPAVLQHVCDNLDQTSLAIFSGQHNLQRGQTIIVKEFDDEIDGVYEVLSVPSLTKITIGFRFRGNRTTADGTGVVFYLQSQRIAQFADAVNLDYITDQNAPKVYVDNDGTGRWAVYQRRDVLFPNTELSPKNIDATERYGTSLALGESRQVAMVGSPRYGFAAGIQQGAIYVYVKNFADIYQPVSPTSAGDALLTLDAPGVRAYGSALTIGAVNWAAGGAPGSIGGGNQINNGLVCLIYRDLSALVPDTNPYRNWQILTSPNIDTDLSSLWPVNNEQGEMGAAVAMSKDERWLYVGAPGINEVYAYARVDYETQFVRAVSDGSTSETFDISERIRITAPTQLEVTYDGAVQDYPGEWTVNDELTEVTLLSPPPDGTDIRITRLGLVELDGRTYRDIGAIGSSGSGAQFTVVIRRNTATVLVQDGGAGYTNGETLMIPGSYFADSGWASPANDITFTVNTLPEAPDVISSINALAYTGPGVVDTFDLGSVFYQVSLPTSTIESFSLESQEPGATSVVLLRPNIDYVFDDVAKTVTFVNSPVEGSVILARSQHYWKFVAQLTVPGMDVTASGSTNTIGIGPRVFVTDTGLGYVAQQSIRASVDDANFMEGVIDDYDPATGVLSITAGSYTGSGTYNEWKLTPLDRFGSSMACTTDGSAVIVGSPNSPVGSSVRAGRVYYFTRSIQRFIYGQDTPVQDSTIATFTVSGAVSEPISVTVNGRFLQNELSATDKQSDVFRVAGNQIIVDADLIVGDVVEIATNQFTLTQTLENTHLEDFGLFGSALDICFNDCSLYIGEPGSSQAIYKGGQVERYVNQARRYGIITSTRPNPSLVAGDTIRINNQEVAVPAAPNNTLSGLAAAIESRVPNTIASVANGVITLSVANQDSAIPRELITVAPGSIGTAFFDIGFDTFVFTQEIFSPRPLALAGFGNSIALNSDATQLAVGADRDNMFIIAVWDDGATDWDLGITDFFSVAVDSGSVYLYDVVPAVDASVSNPDTMLFGQALELPDLEGLDQLGNSMAYRDGLLWMGAPGSDIGDSSSSNYGRVYVWENPTRGPAWQVLYRQKPTVDVRLLNSVFLYDRISNNTVEYLDFFNPLQGKILGAARQNINYIGSVDPANYNTGPARGGLGAWGAEHVGEVWWDTSSIRFIDPNQDDITYTARRWAQIFPGSRADVYQWVQSSQPPSNYQGPGTPLGTLNYVVSTALDNQGVINTSYYFWVQELTDVAEAQGKTLSVQAVASYIEDPRSTGIPYLAPLNANTVAIYNCQNLIEAQDTVLHIEYDRELTTENVHTEYELIAEGRPDDFLSDALYRKLQDSLCGVDTAGNLVPDIFLSPPERYGVFFRPRQSMFVDRFEALKNYIDRTNSVLAQYPIAEIRSFTLLNSQEPIPPADTGVWDMAVDNLEILGFQNIYAVPLGYRYLVLTDSSQRGLWSIYTVVIVEGSQADSTANRSLLLSRVQNFRTNDYWRFINWYAPGYDSSTRPVAEVANTADLQTLEVANGLSVKVTANAQGRFEIYRRDANTWTRVGVQNGTIAIDTDVYDYAQGRFGFDVEVFDAQYFDQEPVLETRQIIKAINQELLIDDLLIERNRLLTLMFDYVLSEQNAPGWLTKTSLIDVDHRIRELLPFQNYNRDNQEFVLDYLREVKPYHTQIREFSLQYFGSETYLGDIVDFDVPAYFNSELVVPGFVSPVLLPYKASVTQTNNTLSDAAPTDSIWQDWPWNQWYDNYLLIIDTIELVAGGSGYTEAPQVIIQGDATTPATARAVINSAGSVTAVIIETLGSGYRDAPVVVFSGGNGSGAQAYARLIGQGNAQVYSTAVSTITPQPYNLTRTFRTVLRYDRFQYRTQVLIWSPDGTYDNGTLVRYDNRIWVADADDSTAIVGPTFDLEKWRLVDVGQLDLVFNAQENYYELSPGAVYVTGTDRTTGLYRSSPIDPGLDLAQLIPGIVYPGVQVWGDYFAGNLVLDTELSSSFDDGFLGIRATDINVDGGQFIGLAEAHAPEELVNGSEFDTLDLRVYTRPGSDWQRDGHGFQIRGVNERYLSATNPEISWAGLVEYPFQVLVSNQTKKIQLADTVDYQVDWENQTVFVEPGGEISEGDLIAVRVFELGGGSQLYRNTYASEDIASGVFQIPVNAAEIQDLAIFIDGVLAAAAPSWVPYIASQTWDITVDYGINTVVSNSGSYYRSVQAVPAGTAITNTDYWSLFVPTLLSQVDMQVPPPPGTFVSVCAFGAVTVAASDLIAGRQYTITDVGSTDWINVGAASSTVGETFTATGATGGSGLATTDYSWSTPVVQLHVADATTIAQSGFALDNDIAGSNVANMIVIRNGLRLAPPAGISWIGDDTSVSFGLPQRMGASFLQSSINAITDIKVWVDDVLQTQSFGSFVGDYSVTPWSGSNTPGRQVIFNNPPVSGSRILITVSTLSSYAVAGDFLELFAPPNLGDIYQVITWNDTSQQELLTQVFYGPEVQGSVIEEGYDSAGFDLGNVTGDAGSFDYSSGTLFSLNNFVLDDQDGRTAIEAVRLWVTLDGNRLFEGQDFTIVGNELVLSAGVIGSGQVLVVTQMTDSVVPEAAEFRVFQDMRGQQVTYRMTPASQTVLAQDLSPTADVIYVVNAAALTQPDLVNGIFGDITVGSERITYREIDFATNSLLGLRRGVAGTGAGSHTASTIVYDISDGNKLASDFQDVVVSDTTLTDGELFEFSAPSIRITDFGDSSSIYVESIEVTVGGIAQLPVSKLTQGVTCEFPYIITDAGGDDSNLTIEIVSPLDLSTPNPPPAGRQVSISQRRGTWWYDLTTDATRRLALQETDTEAARFLTGSTST